MPHNIDGAPYTHVLDNDDDVSNDAEMETDLDLPLTQDNRVMSSESTGNIHGTVTCKLSHLDDLMSCAGVFTCG